MLDFSWSHILLFLIIALVVVGPKDLPRLMRIIGQWMGKARAMADQFRKSFDDMARQAELDELRKEIDNLRSERPLADLERELHQSILPDDMRGHVPPPQAVSAVPEEIETAPYLPDAHVPDAPMPDMHMPDMPMPDAHADYGLPAEPVAADGYKPPPLP
ncbi:MAG TPA: Sec-independent protein translocase protein TatB [Rhizomicrobium sp.]